MSLLALYLYHGEQRRRQRLLCEVALDVFTNAIKMSESCGLDGEVSGVKTHVYFSGIALPVPPPRANAESDGYANFLTHTFLGIFVEIDSDEKADESIETVDAGSIPKRDIIDQLPDNAHFAKMMASLNAI